ncbi:MAG TPA: hypothetical protein VF710_06995, partial [Longimicrobium sp.]
MFSRAPGDADAWNHISAGVLGGHRDYQLLAQLAVHRDLASDVLDNVSAEALERGRSMADRGALWNPFFDAVASVPFSPFAAELRGYVARFNTGFTSWLRQHGRSRCDETLLVFRFMNGEITTHALEQITDLDFAMAEDVLRAAPHHVHTLAWLARLRRLGRDAVEAVARDLVRDLTRSDAGPKGCGELWCP